MAKFDFEAAVAFATQSGEGSYDSTLDAITTSLATADGLVLGHPSAGERESGLSAQWGRLGDPKSFFAGSFTRPLDDFIRREIRQFQFAFPFVGNRATVSGAPADSDAVPITGVDALLRGAGLVGAAWGGGVGHQYVFGSPNPISALLYVSGLRLELLDCRVETLSIVYTAGAKAIATATISVGSIQDGSAAALPTTLDYGDQADVATPNVEAVGAGWQDTRGFQELTLEFGTTVEEQGDSNATDGVVKEITNREARISARMFADDSANKIYDWEQLGVSDAANLDALGFQVGSDMADTFPASAHQIIIPKPQLDESTPRALGSKAGSEVNLIARGTVANNEVQVIFR